MAESLQFNETIKKIEVIYRTIGINIRSGEISRTAFIKSRIIYMINFFWLNFDLAGGIYWFIDGVKTGKDFLGLTYIAPCISFSTMANFKGLLLVLNEKHVNKLVGNLRNLEKREKEREYSQEKEEIISKERKLLNLIINLLNWANVIVLITFAMSPIAIMGVKYYRTGEIDLILPFLILYPFDPYQIKYWPFVYLHQIWSECVVTLSICSADYFFFTCCTYIRIQFKLLQYSVENIIPLQKDISRKRFDNEEFKSKLRDTIRWHQELIESCAILEIIYSKSTLFNFFSSSLVICLTGFNVTVMVNDVVFVVTFLSFLFMSLFQVYFLCFFADLLRTASMEITDAIYESQWYLAEASVAKKLHLMQIRAREPCKLTAFGFAEVNLNSFMRVLSTAWSYFALLQTIYGR